MPTVECEQHGSQAETFVCQHVVQSLRDGTPRGFYWAQGTEQARPDAWCSECEARVAAAGDWTDEVLDYARVKVLCGACYDAARRLNGFGPDAAR